MAPHGVQADVPRGLGVPHAVPLAGGWAEIQVILIFIILQFTQYSDSQYLCSFITIYEILIKKELL